MALRRYARIGFLGTCLSFSSCYSPPYNNFKPYDPAYVSSAKGALIGTAAGAVVGPVLIGTAVGALVGAGIGKYKDSKDYLIKELQRQRVQYIEYGDLITIILPTDKYFFFNSAHFKQPCFSVLDHIIKLIQLNPECPIYVAGFTDSVGSRAHKNKLSQARAEAVVAFLWANQLSAFRLNPEGYGDKNDVADNTLIHGSAHNRRIEIQFMKKCPPHPEIPSYQGYIK